MATEAQNFKMARVPSNMKATLEATVLSVGSTVFDETEKRVVVGDGSTKGGVPMAKKSEVETVEASVEALDAETVKTTDVISIAKGGTGATTAAAAREALDAQSKTDLETALEELIVEFGGTVPTD